MLKAAEFSIFPRFFQHLSTFRSLAAHPNAWQPFPQRNYSQNATWASPGTAWGAQKFHKWESCHGIGSSGEFRRFCLPSWGGIGNFWGWGLSSWGAPALKSHSKSPQSLFPGWKLCQEFVWPTWSSRIWGDSWERNLLKLHWRLFPPSCHLSPFVQSLGWNWIFSFHLQSAWGGAGNTNKSHPHRVKG